MRFRDKCKKSSSTLQADGNRLLCRVDSSVDWMDGACIAAADDVVDDDDVEDEAIREDGRWIPHVKGAKLKSIYCTCSLLKFLFPTHSYPDPRSLSRKEVRRDVMEQRRRAEKIRKDKEPDHQNSAVGRQLLLLFNPFYSLNVSLAAYLMDRCLIF